MKDRVKRAIRQRINISDTLASHAAEAAIVEVLTSLQYPTEYQIEAGERVIEAFAQETESRARRPSYSIWCFMVLALLEEFGGAA